MDYGNPAMGHDATIRCGTTGCPPDSLILLEQQGEIVCTYCGTVFTERAVDYEPEWRNFEEDHDEPDKSRVKLSRDPVDPDIETKCLRKDRKRRHDADAEGPVKKQRTVEADELSDEVLLLGDRVKLPSSCIKNASDMLVVLFNAASRAADEVKLLRFERSCANESYSADIRVNGAVDYDSDTEPKSEDDNACDRGSDSKGCAKSVIKDGDDFDEKIKERNVLSVDELHALPAVCLLAASRAIGIHLPVHVMLFHACSLFPSETSLEGALAFANVELRKRKLPTIEINVGLEVYVSRFASELQFKDALCEKMEKLAGVMARDMRFGAIGKEQIAAIAANAVLKEGKSTEVARIRRILDGGYSGSFDALRSMLRRHKGKGEALLASMLAE